MISHYTWGSMTTLHDFLEVCWDGLWTLSLGSHNFMVTALGYVWSGPQGSGDKSIGPYKFMAGSDQFKVITIIKNLWCYYMGAKSTWTNKTLSHIKIPNVSIFNLHGRHDSLTGITQLSYCISKATNSASFHVHVSQLQPSWSNYVSFCESDFWVVVNKGPIWRESVDPLQIPPITLSITPSPNPWPWNKPYDVNLFHLYFFTCGIYSGLLLTLHFKHVSLWQSSYVIGRDTQIFHCDRFAISQWRKTIFSDKG